MQTTNEKDTDSECEGKETLQQIELKEPHINAAQMDSSTNWCSDFMANWTDKWDKAKSERNKARSAANRLRTKLEEASKCFDSYEHEKQELKAQNKQLKKDVEKIHLTLLRCAGQIDSHMFEYVEMQNGISNDNKYKVNSLLDLEKDVKRYSKRSVYTEPRISNSHEIKNKKTKYNQENDLQKMSKLLLRLEDAINTSKVETEEKQMLHKRVEELTNKCEELNKKIEELKEARVYAARELLALRVQLQDKTELETLQDEDAVEWEKQECLETEKLELERENKNTVTELHDLQKWLETSGRSLNSSDVEFSQLQQETFDKNKEIIELRLLLNKLLKMVKDKNVELEHTNTYAKQYKSEVTKLRTRIEEFKHGLAVFEDVVLDSAMNNIKRLQRINYKLLRQIKYYQDCNSEENKGTGEEEMSYIDQAYSALHEVGKWFRSS